MRLVTYSVDGPLKLGLVTGDAVIDVAGAAAAAPHRLGTPPPDMLALLQSGEAGWQSVSGLADWANAGNIELLHADFVKPLNTVRLAPPIPNPSKIVCIGLNYADHCREQNVPAPERPLLFSKFPTTLIGMDDCINWSPEESQQVDFEAELAVIIGRQARRVPAERAFDVIAGYTIANDVSARDVQFADQQWVRGKSFDTFCPLGPALVTADEIPDPQNLAIKCRVNGQTLQDSNTSEMIFKIPTLIEFITRNATLLPGDVICTGTPNGVGVFRNPKVFLKPGDAVEIEIDGLELLRNTVV